MTDDTPEHPSAMQVARDLLRAMSRTEAATFLWEVADHAQIVIAVLRSVDGLIEDNPNLATVERDTIYSCLMDAANAEWSSEQQVLDEIALDRIYEGEE